MGARAPHVGCNVAYERRSVSGGSATVKQTEKRETHLRPTPTIGAFSEVGITFRKGTDLSHETLHGIAFEKSDPDFWKAEAPVATNEPQMPAVGADQHQTSGVIAIEPDGRVWMRRSSGGYGQRPGSGGYTFSKGQIDPGLTPQQTALKETREETGLATKRSEEHT